MNRIVTIALCVLMLGCVGSATPHNPLDREGPALWWQADTTVDELALFEWEKFIPVHKPKDWSNPWADYKEPRLFPEGWKPQDYLNPDQEQKLENTKLRSENQKMRKALRHLLRPKVEKETPRKKTMKQRLEDLWKREKKYFDRSI